MTYHAIIRRVLTFLSEPFGASPVLWLTVTIGPVVLLAALTVYNGAIHIMAPWDVFTLLEGGWRVHGGLIPHVDFYNPIGSLTYELISIGMSLGDLSAASITYAIVIFLAILVPWSWFVASHRLSGFVASVFTLFTCVLVVAARPLGYDPGVTTYAMIYNRFSWVLLSILLLQLFVAPRSVSKRGGMLEGISVGGLLVLLFFCKISYFGMGVIAVLVASGLRPSLIRSLGYTAATFIAGCFLWWVLFDIGTFAYLSDLGSAAGAQSAGHRLRYLLNVLKANIWPVFALLLVWTMVLVTPFKKAIADKWYSGKVKLSVGIAFICATSFLIATGNAPEGTDLPLYFVMGAIILEFISRNVMRNSQDGLSASETAHVLALLVVLPLFVIPIAAKDALSVYYATKWREYRVSKVPDSQIFDAAPLRDMIIPHTSEWQTAYWRAKNVPARINEGIELLRRHVSADTRLFAMAFTNPFSFALELPPPKGPPLWWDIDFSVSADAFPDPDAIFSNVDMVIIPILRDEDDGCCKETVHRMVEVYGPYLSEHFRDVERTVNWELMERRP